MFTAGRITGVEIVTILMGWMFVVLWLKAQHRRTVIAAIQAQAAPPVIVEANEVLDIDAKPSAARSRRRRIARMARWVAIGALPLTALWLSFSALVRSWQLEARLIHRCNADHAPSCTVACDHGIAGACMRLALLYEQGKGGLQKDAARAVALNRTACDAGHARGCNNLGVMYEKGEGGLTADLKRALALNQKACGAGEPLACNNVGAMYVHGKGGVTQDEHALSLCFSSPVTPE